ncbi:MAG TPA: hypothetical protein PKA63_14595 [Oligoflexia bacterium]|nr:hypothetical protein [Oligoflexia bacterium]HMP49895.1 hypothetical protein [Oligoflexia bacterium]
MLRRNFIPKSRKREKWIHNLHPAFLIRNFNISLRQFLVDSDKKPVSKSWARLIKKVYEVDPLKCPKCGGRMRIKAFIQDSKEITRICENLGLADWRAPPKMGKDRKFQEPEYDDFIF